MSVSNLIVRSIQFYRHTAPLTVSLKCPYCLDVSSWWILLVSAPSATQGQSSAADGARMLLRQLGARGQELWHTWNSTTE